MTKTITQIGFDENGNGVSIFEAPELKSGMFELSSKLTGRNPARYKLVDGAVTDTFKGSDDEFIAKQVADELVRATELAQIKRASKKLTPLEFYGMFTMGELAALYTKAKSDVNAQIFLDQLQVAQDVTLSDPRTHFGLQSLMALGILTAERVEDIINGVLPPQ